MTVGKMPMPRSVFGERNMNSINPANMLDTGVEVCFLEHIICLRLFFVMFFR